MGKIYGKVEVKNRKPKKKKNEHNRLRDVIVNFRVSPKEKLVLDARIAALGMGKQDYYRQSCLYQKILVKGNIRTFSVMKDTLRDLTEKIDRNPDLTQLDPVIYSGLYHSIGNVLGKIGDFSQSESLRQQKE